MADGYDPLNDARGNNSMSRADEAMRGKTAASGDYRVYDDDGGESDCTFPEGGLDLRQKEKLLRWQYLPGGQRLPRYAPRIPHIDEAEVKSNLQGLSSGSDGAAVEGAFVGVIALAERLAKDARKLQQEYMFAKQQTEVQREERDLLKWHLANNSKALKMKRGQLNIAGSKITSLEHKYRAMCTDTDRLQREKNSLTFEYDRLGRELTGLESDYAAISAEMQQWLGRRGDYLADATNERRLAGKERRLRNRQLNKLYRTANVDKKWHTKIDAVRNADDMIIEAYEEADKGFTDVFAMAAPVTQSFRQQQQS